MLKHSSWIKTIILGLCITVALPTQTGFWDNTWKNIQRYWGAITAVVTASTLVAYFWRKKGQQPKLQEQHVDQPVNQPIMPIVPVPKPKQAKRLEKSLLLTPKAEQVSGNDSQKNNAQVDTYQQELHDNNDYPAKEIQETLANAAKPVAQELQSNQVEVADWDNMDSNSHNLSKYIDSLYTNFTRYGIKDYHKNMDIVPNNFVYTKNLSPDTIGLAYTSTTLPFFLTISENDITVYYPDNNDTQFKSITENNIPGTITNSNAYTCSINAAKEFQKKLQHNKSELNKYLTCNTCATAEIITEDNQLYLYIVDKSQGSAKYKRIAFNPLGETMTNDLNDDSNAFYDNISSVIKGGADTNKAYSATTIINNLKEQANTIQQ